MPRTRRAAIDGGFEQAGNEWDFSASFASFPLDNYVQFSLPFGIELGGNGGNQVYNVTLWANGVLSLGAPTQEQIDFVASGASPIPGEGNPGFPGFFFLFDHEPGNLASFYSYGIGFADYEPPFEYYEGTSAAFFTFENGYQIILDPYGFAIVPEFSGAGQINGYSIGGLQVFGSDLTFDSGTIDFLTYGGTADPDTVTGTEYHEVFLSSEAGDVIDAAGGIDLIDYSASHAGIRINLIAGTAAGGHAEGDTLFNAEEVIGSGFADHITGTAGNNYLRGLDGADLLVGDAGDDFIEGGAGADALRGGAGIDTLSYASSSAGVDVSLATLTVSGGDANGDTLSNFENVMGSQHADTLELKSTGGWLDGAGGDDALRGMAGIDSLHGSWGDDFLVGGLGGDTLDGGGGIDTASYAAAAAAVALDLTAGTGTLGEAAGDVFTDLENIIATRYTDTIVGNWADNRFEGGSGADTLSGRAGSDVLLGGRGADRLYGEDGTDTLLAGDGNDHLYGGAGVDVMAGGAGNDVFAGGLGNDILQGDDGDDRLDGNEGVDSLSGGLGNDSYYVDHTGDLVLEEVGEGTLDQIFTEVSYTLAADSEIEVLSAHAIAALRAIALTGNVRANTLIGNAGANLLDGRGGADTMRGNAGNDIYIVDTGSDVVEETSASGGIDEVRATASFTLGAHVENLVLLGTASIAGTGNSLANLLTGNSGANTLDGGSGIDTLRGGLGDDRYVVDRAADVIVEAAGEGYDRVFAGGNYRIAEGVSIEALAAANAAGLDPLALTGNSFANAVTGNAGENTLNGAGGDDTLSGLTGNDTLLGGIGADTLTGGAGNDILDGGTGADTLTGNSGADVFRFTAAPGEVDRITDYNVAADRIELDDAAFAGLALGALAAGAFVTGSAATEADDRILYDSATGALWFDADGSGAGAAVQFATLATGLALSASEFTII